MPMVFIVELSASGAPPMAMAKFVSSLVTVKRYVPGLSICTFCRASPLKEPAE